MFEHPQLTYDAIAVEQKRIDRANEMRRIVADSPERIVPRQHPILRRLRSMFRNERTDAAAQAIASDRPRVICDPAAQAAHAR